MRVVRNKHSPSTQAGAITGFTYTPASKQSRIFSKTEVIIASQHDTTLTLHFHYWSLTRLQCMEIRIDIAAFYLFQKVMVALLK
jgi:hypothetical protein